MISTAEQKKAQILDALSVEQIYGPRIELHPHTGTYSGLCAFHSEKTPSFVVYPDKHFHCFGCQKHGSAFDFVMEMYGLDFQGALRHLASQAGIPFNGTANNSRARNRTDAPTTTVAELARDKLLPEEFLRSLGLKDTHRGVEIPYFWEDGAPAARHRIRTALKARNGSYWETNARVIVPYGLQRLADARSAGFLVIVEGESDSWTLWHHGFPCLGIPGASFTKCLQPDHIAGIKKIFIVEEPGEGGSTFVDGLRKRLAQIRWAGEAKIVSLHPHKDPNELHKANPEMFPENFYAYLDAAQSLAPDEGRTTTGEIPEGWPEPLAPEAFHGLAGEFASTVAPQTESDPAALLIQFLLAVGNVIGHGPHFNVEQQPHHVNLFALIVGNTSKARKGTSLSRVRAFLSAVDPVWVEKRIHGGAGSGEGIIWAVRDPILKGEELEDEGVEDKRLLLQETEFAQVLQIFERQGATLSETLRRAWDGMPLQILTKNSPARATGAHVSVLGHITKPELVRHLSATEVANGFANRFIFVCVRRSKCLPDGGELDWGNHPQIVKRMEAAIRFARDVGEMRRTSEARSLWHEVYPALSDGRPGLLGSVISRAEAQVLRLSMLYALLDCSAEIRREHLAAALAVWRYAEDSCRYIFGDSLGDPIADETLRILRAEPEGLTRAEISKHFGRNLPEAHMTRALRLLQENGLATFRREETGGRAAERWFAATAAKKATGTS